MAETFSFVGTILETFPAVGPIVEIISSVLTCITIILTFIELKKAYGYKLKIKFILGLNGSFNPETGKADERYGFIIDVTNYSNFDIEFEDIMAKFGQRQIEAAYQLGSDKTIRAKSAIKAMVEINQGRIDEQFSACSPEEKIYIIVKTPITTYKKYSGFTVADLINKYQEYIKANNKK